jgi:hypothetical protein
VCIVNEPPSFTETPSSVEVIEGANVEFTCRARGKPLPDITWLRDDQAIDSENILASQKPDSFEVTSSYTIPSARLEDESARYRIEAENNVGKYATHEFALIGESLYKELLILFCFVLFLYSLE